MSCGVVVGELSSENRKPLLYNISWITLQVNYKRRGNGLRRQGISKYYRR